MKVTPKEIIGVSQDRERPIEIRIGAMFVSIGIIICFIGIVICLVTDTNPWTIGTAALLTVLASLAMALAFKKGKFRLIRDIMMYTLMVVMPIIFFGAGGMNSGVPAWEIYTMFFITIACRGRQLYICLAITFISDVVCFVIDANTTGIVYHYSTVSEKFISIIGSCTLVAIGILSSVLLYKKMYNEEREYLQEKSRELERANECERNFLATMSHELRTPINSIIGFNELILNESNEEDIVYYATDVKNSSNFLLSLINDILDYSKIDAGQMLLVNEDYDVAELIKTTFDVVNKRAKDKNLELIVKVHPDLPARLHGDMNRIRQIMVNLLTNAIKYTKDGTVTLTVSPDYIEGNDGKICRLSILVADTGSGISKENLDLIFTAFKRVDLKKNKTIEGTGLGLAIVKSLVDLMDGKIEVESVVGVGSRFNVIIDQTVVSATKIGRFVVDADTSTEGRPSLVNKDRKPIIAEEDKIYKILAVDDTDTNLRVLKLLLKNEIYKVETATNGADAVEMVKNNDYTVVLMDIMMPHMSGVEALKKIREFNTKVPVIALTADAVSGAREEYLSKGFDGYLTKPLHSDKVRETIKKYL